MKKKVKELFKDKLTLVALVLGLLTIVSAAGVATIHRGSQIEQTPYAQMDDGGRLAEGKLVTEPIQLAGESDAQKTKVPESEPVKTVRKEIIPLQEKEPADEQTEAAQAGSGQDKVKGLVLNFSGESRLAWPVEGNVLLDYSMDQTIYHPTLEQYKCSPGIVIQGEISTPVLAPANARVLKAGMNEEIGNFLNLDLGNGYTAVCGQLKEVVAAEGEYLEKGQLLGYIAEPTKYYTIEGSNVYFQLMHDGKEVDPLDYLE